MIDGMSVLRYLTIREHIAADIRMGILEPTPQKIAEAVERRAALGSNEASDVAIRFLSDVQRLIG